VLQILYSNPYVVGRSMMRRSTTVCSKWGPAAQGREWGEARAADDLLIALFQDPAVDLALTLPPASANFSDNAPPIRNIGWRAREFESPNHISFAAQDQRFPGGAGLGEAK